MDGYENQDELYGQKEPNPQVHIRNLFTEKETRQTAGTERMRKLPNPEKRAAVLRKNW